MIWLVVEQGKIYEWWEFKGCPPPLHTSNREKGNLQNIPDSSDGSDLQFLNIKGSSNIYCSNLDPLDCKRGMLKY